MKQSRDKLDDCFMTTNQDYGSFYSGRLQYRRTNPDEIAFELAINEQVRNERRRLPSIAYDIMFDVNLLHILHFFSRILFFYIKKHDSLKIVTRGTTNYKVNID